MTTDNFCFYFQKKLIQTIKTGGQQYSDTSPFSIPWMEGCYVLLQNVLVKTNKYIHTYEQLLHWELKMVIEYNKKMTSNIEN